MIPSRCPQCHSGLEIRLLCCPQCQTRVEGQFGLGPLERLSGPEIEFLLAFVKSSGSLKELAKRYRLSYPTIRNRLNDLIAKLDASQDDAQETRRGILERVERGELSAVEAAKILERRYDHD